jgi:hypothetical protein
MNSKTFCQVLLLISLVFNWSCGNGVNNSNLTSPINELANTKDNLSTQSPSDVVMLFLKYVNEDKFDEADKLVLQEKTNEIEKNNASIKNSISKSLGIVKSKLNSVVKEEINKDKSIVEVELKKDEATTGMLRLKFNLVSEKNSWLIKDFEPVAMKVSK